MEFENIMLLTRDAFSNFIDCSQFKIIKPDDMIICEFNKRKYRKIGIYKMGLDRWTKTVYIDYLVYVEEK